MNKKILGTIMLGWLILLPSAVMGATINMISDKIETEVGDEIIISLFIEPQDEKIYTSKVGIEFSSEILKIKEFSFAKDWLALSQPGYDLVDNDKGVLIKTAGYPGGVSQRTLFGTAVFSVDNIGGAQLTIGAESMLLNENNDNKLSSEKTIEIVSKETTLSVSEEPQVIVKTQKERAQYSEENLIQEDVQVETAAEQEEISKNNLKPNILLLGMAYVLAPFSSLFFMGAGVIVLLSIFALDGGTRNKKIKLPKIKKIK